ncbi:MAG: hypothetical protein KC609_10790 [Myxococcales bacterium]|nr:hypothetical protein [Myxococcales bacterium]
MLRRSALIMVLVALLFGCQGNNPVDDTTLVEQMDSDGDPFVTPEKLLAPPADELGKTDSGTYPSIRWQTNTKATQVWKASNKWEDTDTADAKKAGLAWSENSGLTWEQKYSRWIASLTETQSASDWYTYKTFVIKNPWGKELPSPKLECAEMAMFLRATFAAWYKLPFFIQSYGKTNSGTWVRTFLGHNGWYTSQGIAYHTGRNFALLYKDYSTMTVEQIDAQGWPHDSVLRKKRLGDDDQVDYIEPGARMGAYFDELYLNKRVGHFMILLLAYHGSAHLASPANTYNVAPESIRPGDIVLERWQAQGIGHTLIVKTVKDLSTEENGVKKTALMVELVSGSMPRRQGKWEDAVAAKRYLTNEYTGSNELDENGTPYAKLGGGHKRWRVTKAIGSWWVNTIMDADETFAIGDSDWDTIGKRPETFETILVNFSPDEQLKSLVANIESQRQHLRNYPASCSARTRREEYFADLYKLGEEKLGLTRAQIDQKYRKLEDYVLAELVYTKSKTCCFNSSTRQMFEAIMDLNVQRLSAYECQEVIVFKATAGGYDAFKRHAEEMGLTWVDWRADESCPQSGVQDDTQVDENPGFCSNPDPIVSTYEG